MATTTATSEPVHSDMPVSNGADTGNYSSGSWEPLFDANNTPTEAFYKLADFAFDPASTGVKGLDPETAFPSTSRPALAKAPKVFYEVYRKLNIEYYDEKAKYTAEEEETSKLKRLFSKKKTSIKTIEVPMMTKQGHRELLSILTLVNPGPIHGYLSSTFPKSEENLKRAGLPTEPIPRSCFPESPDPAAVAKWQPCAALLNEKEIPHLVRA